MNSRKKDGLATVAVFGFIGYIGTGVVQQVIWPLLSDPQKLENMIERIISIHLITGGVAEMLAGGYGQRRY